jgi:hypothetical protein
MKAISKLAHLFFSTSLHRTRPLPSSIFFWHILAADGGVKRPVEYYSLFCYRLSLSLANSRQSPVLKDSLLGQGVLLYVCGSRFTAMLVVVLSRSFCSNVPFAFCVFGEWEGGGGGVFGD